MPARMLHQPRSSLQRIIIADPGVADVETLLWGGADDAPLTLLAGDRPPLAEIDEAICSRRFIIEIRIFALAYRGGLHFSSASVTTDDLLLNADAIRHWRSHLADDAAIQLHACECAADDAEFVGALERLSGAEVALTVLNATDASPHRQLDDGMTGFSIAAPLSTATALRHVNALETPTFGENP